MLYLIGLGLNEKGISMEGIDAVRACSKIYLEGYTVNFPYSTKVLEETLKKPIISLGRGEVESDKIIKEAKKENIALLVYGSPLFATTHEAILNEAQKAGVKVKVIFSASVFDAVALSGLQPYKFGKTASLPDWKDKGKSTSFMDIIKNNLGIKAHSLILCDIGLEFSRALEELKEASAEKKMKLNKIAVCSCLGTEKQKIFYGSMDNLKSKEVSAPFCMIIPSDLHFMEEESLGKFAKFA